MANGGFYSLESILDKALAGVELPSEPAPLSEKEQAKHEKWLARKKEREDQAARMRAEMAALRDEQRKKALEEIKSKANELATTSPVESSVPLFDNIVKQLIECRDRNVRANLEEELMVSIEDFVENTLKDPNHCYPSNRLNIEPERFIRSFSDRKRFLFCNGLPVRPSFFLQDKDSESKNFHPAWSKVNGNVVSFEFGSKIPMARNANGDRYPAGTSEVPYFSVQHWNTELHGFKNVMLRYAEVPNEFGRICEKLSEFFGSVMSESRKQFDELKNALDKRVPGVFNRSGRTSEAIKHLLNDYLRAGGDSSHIEEQSVPANKVVVFDLDCKYILVNISHKKSTAINPQEAIAQGVSGFTVDVNGRVSTFLPRHVALIEINGSKMTIVRGV